MAEPARDVVTVDALDAYEDEHAEVLDGELVVEEATSFDHGDAQMSLGIEIGSRYRGRGPDDRGGWWIATEVTVAYEASQGFVHDLAGWRKERVPERPRGRRVTAVPDWVCEILSTNKRKDLVVKPRVLHRHRVGHYWVLDPEAEVLSIYRWHEDGYLLVAAATPGERARLEPFDAVELEVAHLFGDREEPKP
jgi:Uma2 family endonuclease